MSDDPRFPHTRFPNFLSRENYSDLTVSRVCTYLAARRFAYVKSDANEYCALGWQSMTTIGSVFGQSSATVKRNLRWHERNGLIYRKSLPGESWLITFIDLPERFREICDTAGREAAIRDY